MKDRLVFESTRLDNGMMVYSKEMDVPFAMARIHCPVGHFNNTGEILPGTAHLLEHLCVSRSRMHPSRNKFKMDMELEGATFTASTNFVFTEFDLDVVADQFGEAFRGFMSHVFEPVICQDDVLHEVKIVANERSRINHWYPGSDELQNYILTKWKNCVPTSIRQDLGDDPDLADMTAEKLLSFHENYFDPRTFLIIGGSFDKDLVFRELGRIKTKDRSLPVKFNQIGWSNREYHTHQFEEQKHFSYRVGGVIDGRDESVRTGMLLIGRLLTSYTNGTLFNWLRRELGWCYTMNFSLSYGNQYTNSDWHMHLPLNSREQVDFVRAQLRKRIVDSISKKEVVESEIRRMQRRQLFVYQTTESILDSQESFVKYFGGLRTEAELRAEEEQFLDVSKLMELYDKYWAPEVTGEFVAIPRT